MKLLDFFKDNDGNLSSVRLFSFLIVLAFIIDWMRIAFTGGIYDPSWSIITLVGSAMGIKVFQKKFE